MPRARLKLEERRWRNHKFCRNFAYKTVQQNYTAAQKTQQICVFERDLSRPGYLLKLYKTLREGLHVVPKKLHFRGKN